MLHDVDATTVESSPGTLGRRRGAALLLAAVLTLASALTGCGTTPPAAPNGPSATPSPSVVPRATAEPLDAIGDLEAAYGARVGAWVLDSGTGRVLEHRADERFAHASVVKLLLVGLLLRTAGDADLDAVIPIAADDVLAHAPVTSRHVGSGLPLRDLMEAAMVVSDNTAANLLVERLGGPAQVEAGLRELGNATTEVDRTEPTLNEARPGDPRDTSTPAGLGRTVERLVLGDALTPDRRDQLQRWLGANTTGDAAIRAGVPDGWTVGEKTGSGGYGTRNDAGVVRPADGGPPVVVVLLTDRGVDGAASDDALLADVTRAVVAQLGR